jgi:hypothetical protein
MKKSANAETRNIKILVAIVAGALVIILFTLPFLFQGQFDWDDLFRAAGLRNDSQVAVRRYRHTIWMSVKAIAFSS